MRRATIKILGQGSVMLLHDLRCGVRALKQSPRLTAVAVLSLALGIGINTTVFSFVNALQFRPLPYREAERLVELHEASATELCPGCGVGTSYPGFLDWLAQTRSYQELAAYQEDSFVVSGPGEPRRLSGAWASASLFSVLGVRPVLGRALLAEDERAGSEPVVILSHGLWERLFGANRAAVGSELRINGRIHTVVGVMPPEFQFPEWAKLWLPLAPHAQQWPRETRNLGVVGRLKREVTLEAAASELRTVASRLERQYPETNRRWSAAVRSLREDLAAETAPLANLLFGAVAFVLAIACANLGHLLLVKAASRERELAVRAALGASRLQLARQLVIEGLLLSLAGGSLGLLLAFWSHQLIPALSDAELPGWLEFLRLDWRVLAFCLLVSVGSGVLFGLIPALPFSRPDLARSLKEGPAASTTVRGARLRSLFVVGQMAVAMLLLAGAGLLIKSLWRASQVDLGYETAHLLRAEIPLLGERAADERRTEAFARQLRLRLGTLPATGVALSRSVFFAGLGGRPQKITAEDRPEVPAGASPHFYEAVTPGYFRTLGVRVLEGREFSDSDRSGGAPVVIVNDELARQIWPGESALGKQLKLGARESQTPWRTIVGVVASSGRSSPGTARPSLAYVPLWQEARGSLTLLIRTPGDPMALANGVRAAVAALDPDQPLENLTSLEAWLGRLLAPWRFMAILMTVLAGGAVLLATIGIYGVISYAAVQRRQEIGIRIALGATSADIRRLVLKSGLRLATSGVAFGLAGAAALTRLLRAVLVGTSPLDPLVFATMAAVLMGIALAAAYFPARGAARIDPVAALRL